MLLDKIQDIIYCPLCGKLGIRVINNRVIASCCDRVFKLQDNQIIIFNDNIVSSEIESRDNQAKKYLTHSKFPTQISRMKKWMSSISQDLIEGITLDLGCGPGPTTEMLLQNGARNIFAADFSINSLIINKETCNKHEVKPIYMLQDITDIRLRKNSISVLIMADFLQHITDKRVRDNFINRVMHSLIPGGVFFLSFFNINIKNYFKNDIKGAFSSGNIKYERLDYKNVISNFPDNIIIEKISPMNIFHHAELDRLFCVLPFSNLFSRMIVIQGRKISDERFRK
tara:strand:- start:68 stop:919 length:852 start_codon:yes stop_codon:yes gene_type:complete